MKLDALAGSQPASQRTETEGKNMFLSHKNPQIYTHTASRSQFLAVKHIAAGRRDFCGTKKKEDDKDEMMTTTTTTTNNNKKKNIDDGIVCKR